MLIQKLITDESAGAVIVNSGRLSCGKLFISAGNTASFDTYYNCMCYTRFRKYTRVKSVELRVKVSGKSNVSLCVFDGKAQVISSVQTDEDGMAVLKTELSELPEQGFMYASIAALTDCEVESAEYHTEAEPDDIHTAAVICTYKREEYAIRNSGMLRSMGSQFIDRVYVIDNGGTLDAEALSDGLVHVLPNKNLGGSGGFTRGIIEAVRSGATHILLMDDDVSFYPESLERMNAFISLLKDEYSESWLSAAMVAIDTPFVQYEAGADWTGTQALIHHHGLDMTDRRQLLDNLSETAIQYGGWWTLLMPASVTERGLPLPLFIKFDDVEYGLRKPVDTNIITMNGVAVRHEAFDRKTSFVLDYYNLRNELIINSIHCGLTVSRALKRFWHEVLKECMLYRYDCCKLVFRAADDYLEGAEAFLDRDNEELNSILIRSAPKLTSLTDIPEWREEMRCDNSVRNNRVTVAFALTLGGHLIPPFLMKKEVSALPLSRAGLNDMFRRRIVIQYQLGGDKGIVTRKSFIKLTRCLAGAVVKSIRLAAGLNKARESYCSHMSELTSFDFWDRQLGLK